MSDNVIPFQFKKMPEGEPEDVYAWALDMMKGPNSVAPRYMACVVQREDGSIGVAWTFKEVLDLPALIGLMHMLIHDVQAKQTQ